MSYLEDVILGRPSGTHTDAPSENTFAEGRIKSVSPAGAMFTVPEWDNGRHKFGPAPWPMSRVEPTDHDHVETKPPVNARCLVVFVGRGVGNPWIIGWWS